MTQDLEHVVFADPPIVCVVDDQLEVHPTIMKRDMHGEVAAVLQNVSPFIDPICHGESWFEKFEHLAGFNNVKAIKHTTIIEEAHMPVKSDLFKDERNFE